MVKNAVSQSPNPEATLQELKDGQASVLWGHKSAAAADDWLSFRLLLPGWGLKVLPEGQLFL